MVFKRQNFFRKKSHVKNEEAHEQIQQQEKQRQALETWAADRVKPWPRKLRIDDYDFRSWAKNASKQLLRAGAIYEYARESRKLRCLLALMNPKRTREDWEEPALLPYCFENLNERDATRALDGYLYCLCDLAAYLADNMSFGELFQTKRDEAENAFGGLNALARVKREFRYFLPVVDAVEVATQSEAQQATVWKTVSDAEKRIITGRACSEVIAIQIHWRFTDSEIMAALKRFIPALRPRDDAYKARQRKKGSRLDSIRRALDCLSAMRLASHFPKWPKSSPADVGRLYAAYKSGDSVEFPPSAIGAIALFNEIRLGGRDKHVEESNFDALIVEARELFQREFPFGEAAANALTFPDRIMMKSERVSSQDKV
jgi:hypothetical protein